MVCASSPSPRLRLVSLHISRVLGLAHLVKACKLVSQVKKDISKLPAQLQKYIVKLREWANSQQMTAAKRSRPKERNVYGECPKTPYPKLTWIQAKVALTRMKMLPVKEDNDRYNINKFLNRLLGLTLNEQNALFDYFTQVFRWVVVTAKSQGKMDAGITVIDGESITFSAGVPECCARHRSVFLRSRSSPDATQSPKSSSEIPLLPL